MRSCTTARGQVWPLLPWKLECLHFLVLRVWTKVRQELLLNCRMGPALTQSTEGVRTQQEVGQHRGDLNGTRQQPEQINKQKKKPN